MKKGGRYKASESGTEFEPGSSGKVLKNLLGIKNQAELDRVESIALKQAEDKFQNLVHKDKYFIGTFETFIGPIKNLSSNHEI